MQYARKDLPTINEIKKYRSAEWLLIESEKKHFLYN